MVIDKILDRKDGITYRAKSFYDDVMAYANTFEDEVMYSIVDAMDEGEEHDVKRALARYIVEHEYNLEIINYINSVDWLTNDNG